MASNITIYCLEKITDYFEFERLCHDIMAREEYHNIEPLGGFSDKGRDAIHVSSSGTTSIFAYSVREDWRAKLAEDASKIDKHGHSCDELVFVTTGDFTAGERDEAKATIKRDYGWNLELYGVERLRILLDNHHPDVKRNHPQVFHPDLLAFEAKQQSTNNRVHLFLSYDPSDKPVAIWLARKLTALGYYVWCSDVPQIGEDFYPEDVDTAITHTAFRVIALYSRHSLRNSDLFRQRVTASNIGRDSIAGFLIPLQVEDFDHQELDTHTRRLDFIDLSVSWVDGLERLITKLEAQNCPKTRADGSGLAIGTIVNAKQQSSEPETLYSNCLEVLRVPSTVVCIRFDRDVDKTLLYDAKHKWACRKVSPQVYLSFTVPPEDVFADYTITQTTPISWQSEETIEGINTLNIISELIRKSLRVKCRELGLDYCETYRLQYFPYDFFDGNNRLKYQPHWGKKTWVNAAGQRTYWRPTKSLEYRYYLAPDFYIRRDLFADFVVILNVRIRFSTPQGKPLDPNTGKVRRKHLCKDWWNGDWLARTTAIADFLGEDGVIVMDGYQGEQLVVSSIPYHLYAARGINEVGLNQQIQVNDE